MLPTDYKHERKKKDPKTVTIQMFCTCIAGGFPFPT